MVSATGARKAKQKTREKQMNDIYITRMMTDASIALAKATQEILRLSKANDDLQKLLDFALAKRGDVNAEQSA